eukprot:gnl/MRDRNA2_/MRDRNA2_81651_c0_seq1.p1 gnl/MRDRNA2_/MRDRNA2_81651_c0~~gnl/MRDRNA2_/MRDRNA2_81651_c0_seq1.p1  ORF type:complete len:348 (-),score=58.77 gnl/MRDRNA2_/MRDRNA2_81651_c0_seq1:87-995(-)
MHITDAKRAGNSLALKLVNRLTEGTGKSWPPHHSANLDSAAFAKAHARHIHASSCYVKKTALPSVAVHSILHTSSSPSPVSLSLPISMLFCGNVLTSCFHSMGSLCLKGEHPRAVELAAQTVRSEVGQAKESQSEVQEATFALGSYAILQDEYDLANFPGIMNTTVGYTGGQSEDPTYETVSRGDGHREALKIEFDPSKTLYEELLEFFWKQYEESPTRNRLAKVNKAIWYHNEEQRKAIEDSISRYTVRTGLNPKINVMPAAKWHVAEGYQQKSRARKRKLVGGPGSLLEMMGDARMQDSR